MDTKGQKHLTDTISVRCALKLKTEKSMFDSCNAVITMWFNVNSCVIDRPIKKLNLDCVTKACHLCIISNDK